MFEKVRESTVNIPVNVMYCILLDDIIPERAEKETATQTVAVVSR